MNDEMPRESLTDEELKVCVAAVADDRQLFMMWWDDWKPGVHAGFIQLKDGSTIAGPLTPSYCEIVIKVLDP